MIEAILCLLIFLGLIPWLIFKFAENMRLPEPSKNLTQTIRLEISQNEFRERFSSEIEQNKYYFIGRIEGDSFLVRYIPPGSLYSDHFLWITLKGQIREDAISYGYTGLISYRKKDAERERLKRKVAELAKSTRERSYS